MSGVPGTSSAPGECGGSGAGASPAAPPERMRGYLETGTASLTNGSIGVMVSYATAPASMLLVLRMAFAVVALGPVVWLSGSWRDLRLPGVPLRVAAISVVLAANLLCYFLAIRATGVAVAIFLSYLAPLYVAFLAPLVFRQPADRVVYVSLALGVTGLGLILVPGLLVEGARLSAAGLLYAWLAGVLYAVYLLLAKSSRGRHVRSTAVVFAQSAFTALVLLPLGLVAMAGAPPLTSTDLLMAALLGLVTTAFSFSLFMDGVRFIRVEHASIVGYLEPVSAPLYAFLFLGQVPSAWTLAGGALIVAAGIIVVRYGRVDPQPELVG